MRAFVQAINSHDTARIANLLTTDHLFVDSLGQELHGGAATAAAFAGYFQMVPGYRINVTSATANRNTVVAFGTAGGGCVPPGHTVSSGTWQIPAAWRAVIRGGRIAEWQVYADNEPLRALMRGGTVG